ncbi:hypothetical protein RYX36_031483, partial [Vicia faba]
SSSLNDFVFHRPSLPNPFQALTPLFSPIIKTTCIILAFTAFFFMHFHHTPVITTTLTIQIIVDALGENKEEVEKVIKKRLIGNPNDAKYLHALMEVKIKAQKANEAINVINHLIEIELDEIEWP